MAYKTVYNNVIFIEGTDNRVNVKKRVEYKYGFIGPQLKGLNNVKEYLANLAINNGCNCIVEFKYGQKSSWLSLDDTKWYGDGKCGVLSEKDYNTILDEINNK